MKSPAQRITTTKKENTKCDRDDHRSRAKGKAERCETGKRELRCFKPTLGISRRAYTYSLSCTSNSATAISCRATSRSYAPASNEAIASSWCAGPADQRDTRGVTNSWVFAGATTKHRTSLVSPWSRYNRERHQWPTGSCQLDVHFPR